MAYEDFVRAFYNISTCRQLPSTNYVWQEGVWTEAKLGSAGQFASAPQYSLQANNDCKITVILTQFNEKCDIFPIAIYVMNYKGERAYQHLAKDRIAQPEFYTYRRTIALPFSVSWTNNFWIYNYVYTFYCLMLLYMHVHVDIC